MRVSNVVKDYITKEVTKKFEVKYAKEREEAEFRNETRNNILDSISKELEKIWEQEIIKLSSYYSFLELHLNCKPNCYNSSSLTIKDSNCSDNVMNWRRRMNSDINEAVNSIIVTLELGGTKEDLERMIREL
jgi:hypothetical protein